MRIAGKAAIVFLMLAIISSCSVYKKYERPYAARLDTLCVIGWRDFFPDTLLQTLIVTGLENNTSLVNARQKIITAQAAARASKLAYVPGFGLSPDASVSFGNPKAEGTAYSYSIPLKASWEIDISGKLFNKKRIAEESLRQSYIYERTLQTELVGSIAELYYSILKLDAQLEVSRSTAASWKENVRTMKAMKEAGMTNEASVEQTEANACNIEATLYDLEYDITRLCNEMCVLIGIPVQDFPRTPLNASVLAGQLPDSVEMKALGGRPDVQYAESEMRKAFYNTALAHAQFYPSLTISANGGWEKALTSPAGFIATIAGSLAQPLFAKGTLKANLTAAEAQQVQAGQNFRQILLDAGAEVNNALSLISSAQSKTDVRQRQIENLKLAEKSTRQLMRHTQGTYLEVLTAEQSLLAARLLQIADKYDALRGSILLYKALGGGVD